MRVFKNFTQAINEIKRDLNEMGIPVQTQTMQDKYIVGDQDYETIELQNYVYTVLEPDTAQLELDNPVWAEAEWVERAWGIAGKGLNPGKAYKFREDVWNEFLHDGQFSYTYSERFANEHRVRNLIDRLKVDRFSRQLYIPMWEPEDAYLLGEQRVPCSLGWHLMYREDKLNITYFMRSCDFYTHMQYDLYFTTHLMEYIAVACDLQPGSVTHFMGSCHVYKKDLEHVF